MIAKETEWGLSPAYDLIPSTPVSNERRDLALICGDAGRFANAGNLLSQCTRFLLTREEAQAKLTTMQEYIINNWYRTARASGVSDSDCEKIRSAFLYEGFFYNAV